MLLRNECFLFNEKIIIHHGSGKRILQFNNDGTVSLYRSTNVVPTFNEGKLFKSLNPVDSYELNKLIEDRLNKIRGLNRIAVNMYEYDLFGNKVIGG